MTPVQLASASKTSLLEYIQQLQAAEQEAKAQTQNAIQIANYFSSVILAIENLLLNSPFVNKDGKFFKKVWWVLSNLDKISTVIESIINIIKNWRVEVQKLVDQQKAQQSVAPTTPE